MDKAKMKSIAKSLIPTVCEYLAVKAVAEIEREKVDREAVRILMENEYFSTDSRRGERERITEKRYDWLMSEEDLHDYLTKLRAALEAIGYQIKQGHDEPAWSYYCPALVAKNALMEVEYRLVDQAAEALEGGADFRHKLLCAGLDEYHKFVDLTLKFVVNSPGFPKSKKIQIIH